jgi:hypothetical protein
VIFLSVCLKRWVPSPATKSYGYLEEKVDTVKHNVEKSKSETAYLSISF